MSRRNDKVYEINKNIGNKIRNLRLSKGWSQARMAPLIHVTMQQLQKYETGVNVISAARLILLASELGISTNYFYEDFTDVDITTENQTLSLWASRNFRKINNVNTKQAINKLLMALVDDECVKKEGSND